MLHRRKIKIKTFYMFSRLTTILALSIHGIFYSWNKGSSGCGCSPVFACFGVYRNRFDPWHFSGWCPEDRQYTAIADAEFCTHPAPISLPPLYAGAQC